MKPFFHASCYAYMVSQKNVFLLFHSITKSHMCEREREREREKERERQITATNIISLIAGLSLKYKNQMVEKVILKKLYF